jgi:hypothetical protein
MELKIIKGSELECGMFLPTGNVGEDLCEEIIDIGYDCDDIIIKLSSGDVVSFANWEDVEIII